MGSKRSRRQEPAVAGVPYLIGQTRYNSKERPDRQGVIFASGNGYEPSPKCDEGRVVSCAACIETETRVMLAGIPPALQKRLGIGQVEIATFVPGTGRGRSQDKIRIGEKRLFKLWEFADQGVTLSLVMAETDTDTKAASMHPIDVHAPAPAMA